jgi:hypothetical protein
MTQILQKLLDTAAVNYYLIGACKYVKLDWLMERLEAAIREQEQQAGKPLQLREGAYYQRRDGKIVGPIQIYRGDNNYFEIGAGEESLWRRDGVSAVVSSNDLIREVTVDPDFRVQPAPDHNCLSCRFFHSDRNTEFSRLGECRFNPPSIREAPSSNGPIYVYPRVYYTNPCGRYEVRK